ncbi:MAG: TVP38/TMEM64 family protein [Alphaproteobacteria bacterium]|nr:TVP38/TMEM64 family protein [Alphaproteobacteria bacterium]
MSDPSRPSPSLARRWLPLAAILLGLAAFWALELDRYLSFAALKQNRAWLLEMVAQRPWLAPAAYVGIYAAAVACSVPGAAVLSIAGGLMFGAAWGTLWAVIGATIGATAVFLAARSALAEPLRARAGPWLARMESGFRANAFSYLLVLRLVPLFPFFIVNLVPALLGVPLGTYVLATAIGIVPGGFVYVSVGAGLGSVFESGDEFSPGAVLTPEVMLALIGLAVLALVPVAYRRFRRGTSG